MSVLQTSRPSRRGFRAFTVAHPLAAFLIMVFSIAYPTTAPVVLAVHGIIPGRSVIENLPRDADEVVGLMFVMLSLLPSAIYVTWATEGRDGLRRLVARLTRWRFAPRWWVFVLTAVPLVTLASGLLLGDTLRRVDPVTFWLGQLAELLINLLLVNLWEETAWAGVMQTRLERRHTLFVAALITAVPFGFLHWPLAFLGEVSPVAAVIHLVAYIVLGILVRPLAALTMRGARDSVLAFALLHSVFNRTNNPNGIGAGLLEGRAYEVGIVIVMVVLTTVVGLGMRHRLGPADRLRLERSTAREDPAPQPASPGADPAPIHTHTGRSSS